MRPQSNGIVELHDSKQKDRGFNCMKLIQFLNRNNVKDWDDWHGAHLRAANGQCPYTEECPIHNRSVEKILIRNQNSQQLTLF